MERFNLFSPCKWLTSLVSNRILGTNTAVRTMTLGLARISEPRKTERTPRPPENFCRVVSIAIVRGNQVELHAQTRSKRHPANPFHFLVLIENEQQNVS